MVKVKVFRSAAISASREQLMVVNAWWSRLGSTTSGRGGHLEETISERCSRGNGVWILRGTALNRHFFVLACVGLLQFKWFRIRLIVWLSNNNNWDKKNGKNPNVFTLYCFSGYLGKSRKMFNLKNQFPSTTELNLLALIWTWYFIMWSFIYTIHHFVWYTSIPH